MRGRYGTRTGTRELSWGPPQAYFDLWQFCNILPSPVCPEALLRSLLGLLEGQEGPTVDESKA